MAHPTLKADLEQLRKIFCDDALFAIEIGAELQFQKGDEKVIRRTLDRLERLVEGASAGGSATGRPTGRNGGRKPQTDPSPAALAKRKERERKSR